MVRENDGSRRGMGVCIVQVSAVKLAVKGARG